MDRRQFLRMAGFMTVSSAAPVLLSACGGGSPSPSVQPPPEPGSRLFSFPQGVAAGDPRESSIVLWTRVVPSDADQVASLGESANSQVRLIVTEGDPGSLVATTAALAGSLVADVSLNALAQWDHSLRHKLTGLKPGVTYAYQFIAGDSRSMIGRFKTAPAATTDVAELKFAFLSCQDWSVNHWGGFGLLANENVDFIVHLGDYIYETVGEAFQSGAVESAHAALALPDGPFKKGANGPRYANTLADYRALYKQYRRDPRLQAVHARFAMIAVWDDHEFSDDCWGDASTYDNGSYDPVKGGDNKHETTRRRAANQAWYEFMPADVVFDASASGFQTIKLYRDFRFGKLMHLVMTDQRLYRCDHVLPEAAVGDATGSRYLVPVDVLAGAEAQKMAAGQAQGDPLALVSILGKPQRDWWKQTMQQSPATWKVWGNEVSLLRMRLDARKLAGVPAALQKEFVLNADQWDGFNAERADLLGFLRSNAIRNVVAITGDIHSFYAGVAHADYGSDTPALVDLVTAGMSSDSFYKYFRSAVDNPAFSSAQPLVFTSDAGAEQIAMQMIGVALAMRAGLDASDPAKVKQAVTAAIQGGLIPASAMMPTAGLSTSPINTFNDLLGGGLGTTIAATIARLAAAARSVAAQTLYGMVAQQIAGKLGIPVVQVPASQVQPFLNPFADPATGRAPVNNPWIRYADTDAQGYAVVTVTPQAMSCVFRKFRTLQNGQVPASVLDKDIALLVRAGVTDVTIA